MQLKSFALVSCLLAASASVGCAAASDEAPAAGESTAQSAGDARLLGGWRFFNTQFDCGSNQLANSVRRGNARHVYAFDGTAGQEVSFALDGEWPRHYGAVIFLTDATGEIITWDYAANKASLSLSTVLAETATYYLWVAPAEDRSVRRRHDYTLSAKCAFAGCQSDTDCAADESCVQVQCVTTPCPALCVAQPTCAELVTVDQRVYAKNFAAGDYQAAQDFVAGFEASMSGINKGTCTELNTKPCNDDAPVCGHPAWQEYPKDYASLCEFQSMIRGEAGDVGEAKGAYSDGYCAAEPRFCATALVDSDLDRYAFYAKNFQDRQAAEEWLSSVFSYATESQVLETACNEPRACNKLYDPVCGNIFNEPETTFGNACALESAVLEAAGSDDQAEAKGRYTRGECGVSCDFTADPSKRYVGFSPEQCQLMRFSCEVGTHFFADQCGCGCEND